MLGAGIKGFGVLGFRLGSALVPSAASWTAGGRVFALSERSCGVNAVAAGCSARTQCNGVVKHKLKRLPFTTPSAECCRI